MSGSETREEAGAWQPGKSTGASVTCQVRMCHGTMVLPDKNVEVVAASESGVGESRGRQGAAMSQDSRTDSVRSNVSLMLRSSILESSMCNSKLI